MSVSRKVLRRMKKVMWLLGTIPVFTACSSQISRADGVTLTDGTLCFSGSRIIDNSWQECYDPSSVRRVIIENGIKGIGEYAFYCCKYLEEITISNSVTSIGKNAFWSCNSLKKITIPSSVTSIGESAFWSCESLEKITIPSSVTSIGEETFYSCRSLKEVTIPNSVTSIGKNAFWFCEFLKEITIPNSVSIIDAGAFWSCKRLETVKFEDMSICNRNSCWYVLLREDSFGGCKKLRILDLGHDTKSRIAKVKKGAFYGCDPNFVALEGSTVRGKFYNTVLNYHYNYFIPHGVLVDKAKYWYR